MKLSIVSTLYQSAPYIEEFYSRCKVAAENLVGSDYEIIFVNDGSPDNSLDLAVQLTEKNPQITVIDLSRNFGHHKAMMTGLAHASGDKVFLIDSDLEEEPEWLSSFDQQLTAEKCDVIYGKQAERKGNWFERLSGNLFYGAFQKLTGLNLPKNIITARLMSKRYVDALLRHEEREIFLAGLWHITGFKQNPQIIKKHSSSDTTYSFKLKMSLFVNSVTSFSSAPLVAIFYTGITISTGAAIYVLYTLIKWFFLPSTLTGWTSLIASIWLLGGLIITFLGVIGIYLAKIFSETKQRPYSIIRKIYGRN